MTGLTTQLSGDSRCAGAKQTLFAVATTYPRLYQRGAVQPADVNSRMAMSDASLLRRLARHTRRRINLFRMKISRATAMARTVETELAPGHPYLASLVEAAKYNRVRSAEKNIAIRDGNRVLNFDFALDLVGKLPAGDYAELGTFRGITASLIWARKAPGATFYSFDTFEGFDDRDLNDARLDNRREKGTFANTSVELVQNRIAGGPHDELVFRVGFFPETFAGLEDRKFRFVHIDMDLADPIRKALEILWPRMVDGGIILVHDYKSARYPMAEETVNRFFAERGITVWPLNDRLGTAMVIRQPGMPA